MSTSTRDTKHIIPFNFPTLQLDAVHQISAMVKSEVLNGFRGEYGRLLSFARNITDIEFRALHTLMQFYDSRLRSFLFTNYIMAPTLEEYSYILDVPFKEEITFYPSKKFPEWADVAKALHLDQSLLKKNVANKGGFEGFHTKFLIDQAAICVRAQCWPAFNAILALCVYRTALFPTVKDFVDVYAVRLFVMRNPVPTLLRDLYHSIHYKTEKRRGGHLYFCAPILHKWSVDRLPKSGAFVDTFGEKEWAPRLMGLRADDLVWINRDLLGREIVISCGGCPSVPLIGSKGGINYNPILSIRKFCYALTKPPRDGEIEEFFYESAETNLEKLKEAAKTRKDLHRKGKSSFGKSNNRMLPEYEEWIQSRVKDSLLPFSKEPHSYPLMVNPPTTVEIEKYDKLKAEVETLRKENRELSREVNGLRHEKNEAKHTAKVNSELLKDTKLELAREIKAKERALEALEQSDMVVASKKKELEQAWSRIAKFNTNRNTAITTNKAKEDQYLEKIAQLKAKLQAKDKEINACIAEHRELEKKFRDVVADVEQLKVQAGVKRARSEGSSMREAAIVDDWELHSQYLTGILHRRDVLICELIQRPAHPDTRKLLKEVQNWCKTHDEWGILARLDLDDVP